MYKMIFHLSVWLAFFTPCVYGDDMPENAIPEFSPWEFSIASTKERLLFFRQFQTKDDVLRYVDKLLNCDYKEGDNIPEEPERVYDMLEKNQEMFSVGFPDLYGPELYELLWKNLSGGKYDEMAILADGREKFDITIPRARALLSITTILLNDPNRKDDKYLNLCIKEAMKWKNYVQTLDDYELEMWPDRGSTRELLEWFHDKKCEDIPDEEFIGSLMEEVRYRIEDYIDFASWSSLAVFNRLSYGYEEYISDDIINEFIEVLEQMPIMSEEELIALTMQMNEDSWGVISRQRQLDPILTILGSLGRRAEAAIPILKKRIASEDSFCRDTAVRALLEIENDGKPIEVDVDDESMPSSYREGSRPLRKRRVATP